VAEQLSGKVLFDRAGPEEIAELQALVQVVEEFAAFLVTNCAVRDGKVGIVTQALVTAAALMVRQCPTPERGLVIEHIQNCFFVVATADEEVRRT